MNWYVLFQFDDSEGTCFEPETCNKYQIKAEKKGTGFPLQLKLKMQKEMKRIRKTCQILRAAPRVCFAIGIMAPWLPTNLLPYFRGVSRTEVWILI
jgi:hypothetical protein